MIWLILANMSSDDSPYMVLDEYKEVKEKRKRKSTAS